MARGSNTYVGTYWTDCAGDMLEVSKIREVIKAVNNEAKWAEQSPWKNKAGVKFPRYRVKLQGRGPRKEAAVADGRHRNAYDRSLPLRHAERVDLYIYERSERYYG
jgi:hypothetical protein